MDLENNICRYRKKLSKQLFNKKYYAPADCPEGQIFFIGPGESKNTLKKLWTPLQGSVQVLLDYKVAD